MNVKTNLERRDQPRHPLTVTVRYASYMDDNSAQTAVWTATTVDLSNKGMQLAMASPVKVPAYVQIALRLGDRTAPISLLAKTVWCRPDAGGGHRAGVEFLGHVDPAYARFIESLGT